MQSSSALSNRSLSGLLYTHNPFYLASALLVLIGLHKALGSDSSIAGGWMLMGILAGYTVMLAAAGFVIVRFGQVWEDARMILLVILLLFVALSVSFDKIVLNNPDYGARFLVIGFWFAMLISESLLAGLGVRLAARYRIPYCLLVALLFGFPLLLGRLSVSGHDDAMAWAVFLFPTAAALVFLTLWPAARTTAVTEPPNGTPWTWPWFPWSLFVFLLLAIGLRGYSLSMAFEAGKGTAASFQPYFLTPLVLVAALLLLEGAIANNRPRLRAIAMALPLAMLAMSLPGRHLNFVAQRFLAMLIVEAGSPLQLSLVGAGAFYALAWLRGVRSGEIGLIGCLAAASWVDSRTVNLETLAKFQWLPMAIVAGLELPLGLWQRTPWRVVVGSLAGTLCVQSVVGFSAKGAYRALRASPLGKGLPWLAAGMVAFVMAVLMSLAKGGLLSGGWRKQRSVEKS